MLWVIFALGAALSWGLYGPALHRGQVELGNPMRALLCVGIAYFLIGVLVPVVTLSSQGQLNGFTMKGTVGAGRELLLELEGEVVVADNGSEDESAALALVALEAIVFRKSAFSVSSAFAKSVRLASLLRSSSIWR